MKTKLLLHCMLRKKLLLIASFLHAFILLQPWSTRTQNVGIGTNFPSTTLDVRRGTASGGTAQFFGTTNITHINYGIDEDTYIRAGKEMDELKKDKLEMKKQFNELRKMIEKILKQ